MRNHDATGKARAGGRVGAVVLAAGSSVRMGTPKALLPWGGGTMIGHVVRTLMEAGEIQPIVVVTGHQAEQVSAAVAATGARCVPNADYVEGGMLSSVRVGMAAVAGEVEGIMLVLCDQPAVHAATLRQLAAAWRESKAAMVIPTHQERRGHPVIFAARLVAEIRALRPPQTLRDMVHRHLDRAEMVPVEDAGVIGDVDTPEDYRRELAQWEQQQQGAANHGR